MPDLSNNQEKTLADFTRRAKNPAIRYARRLGLPEQDAEDAIQAFTLNLLQRPELIEEYDHAQKLRGVFNTLVTNWRRNQRVTSLPAPQVQQDHDHGSRRERILLQQECCSVLLNIATPREQQVFNLFLSDLTFSEIGDVLGVSAQATNQSLSRLINRAKPHLCQQRGSGQSNSFQPNGGGR